MTELDIRLVGAEAEEVLGPGTGVVFASSLTHNPGNGVTRGV
ncbi:hypothetical protein RKD19_001931 [Streptomyces canus]